MSVLQTPSTSNTTWSLPHMFLDIPSGFQPICQQMKVNQTISSFKLFLEGISPYCVVHWYPCFTLLGMSCPGFQSQGGFLSLCFIACVQWIPQIYLLWHTCWALGGQYRDLTFSNYVCYWRPTSVTVECKQFSITSNCSLFLHLIYRFINEISATIVTNVPTILW